MENFIEAEIAERVAAHPAVIAARQRLADDRQFVAENLSARYPNLPDPTRRLMLQLIEARLDSARELAEVEAMVAALPEEGA